MPVFFGFCANERAWKREMKRMGIAGEAFPIIEGKDGRCTIFTRDGKVCCIVTISDRECSDVCRYALIMHEAVHVWQQIREQMGERFPSIEFEAYALQHIAQELMIAYRDTRLPRPGKRKPKAAARRRKAARR